MNERSAEYSKGGLSLLGPIAMGTGVNIAVVVAFVHFYLCRLRTTGEQE